MALAVITVDYFSLPEAVMCLDGWVEKGGMGQAHQTGDRRVAERPSGSSRVEWTVRKGLVNIYARN